MCGATAAQTQLQTEQADFYQEATQEATTAYSEDQQLLGEITKAYEPILQKGPNQQGFSQAEDQTLNAQAVEGTAENYSAAAKAVNEGEAAQGGGNIPLSQPQGAQLKAEVATSAAGQESAEEQQIEQADYQQGFNEFTQAGQAISTASGQLSPTAYTSAATGAGSAASTTAEDIAQENDSWINAAIGAAGSIGKGFAGDFNFGSGSGGSGASYGPVGSNFGPSGNTPDTPDGTFS